MNIQSWTVERFKWHKNGFKKITRESTMNVPIKKITNANNNRISAGTSIWLDMCEFVESTRARKCAHATIVIVVVVVVVVDAII